jgi:isopentenyldiphosphate isomerase
VKLAEVGWFIYQAKEPRGLGIEYEQDVLLVGVIQHDRPIRADPDEIAEWRWVKIDELWTDMKAHQENYVPWFHIGLPKVTSQ